MNSAPGGARLAKGRRTGQQGASPASTEGAPLAIVGVGVSARSLPSLERMFGNLPDSARLAYIIALKPEPGLEAALVVEVLARRSGLPVTLATDGERIGPDHIYVGPAHARLALLDGHLRVEPAGGAPGERGGVDRLLVSLAGDAMDRAAAVVLAGLDSDGVRGLAAVRETGGLTIVEQESPPGPDRLAPIGIAAFVLPAEEIAGRLASFARRLARGPAAQGARDRGDRHRAAIAPPPGNKTSHDFHGHEAGLPPGIAGMGDRAGQPPRPKVAAGIGNRAERVAERYAPAYVVIDGDYHVLRFSGRTGPFLDPSTGSASLNLMSLVHRDLRMAMRAALYKASSEARPVRVERLKLGAGDEARLVTVIVEPVAGEGEPESFVVIFQENGLVSPAKKEVGPSDIARLCDEHISRLEAELRLSRQRLQATTEELRAVNEERQTANGELSHRVNALAKSNSGLKNLLESTQIATVFLDDELRLRTFTPAVTDLFHVLDADVGRPIGQIAARIAYPELEEDARRVLRSLSTVEREIDRADTGARFLVRVLPYRSVDNFIAGVVLTFLDISTAARAEQALRESENRYRLILESATDYAIISMDREGRVIGWNPGARNIFGWDAREMLGRTSDIIFTPEDREAGAPQRELDLALRDGRVADRRWHVRKDGSRLWASGLMTPMGDGAVDGFLKILRDQTAERENDERQKLLLADLQHRVRNILAVVRSVASRTAETSADLEDFASHFDGRLDTLARTQNVLTRSTTATVELEELVRDELLALALLDDSQIAVNGPPVRLRQRAAEVFALALHELATNALKYGALSTPKGRLSVEWRVFNTSAGQRLSLDWRESGVKVLDAMPQRVGFGRDLIERGLPFELGAATSLEFGRGGVRAAIEVPVTEEFGVLEETDGNDGSEAWGDARR